VRQAASHRAQLVVESTARLDREQRRAEDAEARVVLLQDKLMEYREQHAAEKSALRGEVDDLSGRVAALEVELSCCKKERDRAIKAEEQAVERNRDAEEHTELYRREVSRLKGEVGELTPIKAEYEEQKRRGDAQATSFNPILNPIFNAISPLVLFLDGDPAFCCAAAGDSAPLAPQRLPSPPRGVCRAGP